MFKNFRLPQIDVFELNKISAPYTLAQKLMIDSAPEKMNRLMFNTNAMFCLSANDFMYPLKTIATRVTQRFYAYHLNMNGNELVDILSAAKHWTEGIYLYYWTIDTSEELEVGDKLDNWTTKYLYFNHSGKDEYSGWESDISKLEVIIRGLSLSNDISENLKNLYMHANNLDREDVSDIMEIYGLDDIKIFV